MPAKRKTQPRSKARDLWVVLVNHIYVHGVFTSFANASEYADNECKGFPVEVLPLWTVDR